MNKITINANAGTMTLDGDARPSTDDMTDIIESLTRNDDNGLEFQALCNASTSFVDPTSALADKTNAEFIRSCEAWLSGYRSQVPLVE